MGRDVTRLRKRIPSIRWGFHSSHREHTLSRIDVLTSPFRRGGQDRKTMQNSNIHDHNQHLRQQYMGTVPITRSSSELHLSMERQYTSRQYGHTSTICNNRHGTIIRPNICGHSQNYSNKYRRPTNSVILKQLRKTRHYYVERRLNNLHNISTNRHNKCKR